jgi:hypothetical protein
VRSFRGWAERYRELLRSSLGLAMAFSRIPRELLLHDGGCCVVPTLSGEPVAARTRHSLGDAGPEVLQ